MEHEVSLNWLEKMKFEVTQPDGYIVSLDADDSPDQSSTRPKPLLLSALAGCTAMDVISMLQKMRVDIKDMQVKVNGELTEDHPKYYKNMHITYIFTGKDIDIKKIEKAIELSQEKYCGVSALFKMAIPLTYSVEIKA